MDDVAGAAAERIAARVRAGGHIALSGGSTPKAAHQKVAAMGLDWSHTQLWFGDERAVGPEHEHSNYRMAKESLLDHIEGEQPAVHRIQGELGQHEAAAAYEDELRAGVRRPRARSWTCCCWAWGRTGTPLRCSRATTRSASARRLVVGVDVPGMAPLVPRVTLTLPVLDAAHEVVFLISGEDKAEAAARAFADAPSPDTPASLVAPGHGTLTVLIDPPAAARLGANA